MRTISYMQAIGEAIEQEMLRDPAVVSLGEDSTNAWGPTRGLHEKFPGRVFDTPITEAAFVGAAVGASATGLRPIADVLFVDFAGVCFDQLLNQAAKLRYMTGGKAKVPLVVRVMWGAGMRRAAQHSQVLYPLFTHIPGLKVVVPADPHDAKGLMIQAIRDDDPVIFFEHKMLYYGQGDVPAEPYTVPFGKARVVRDGTDCTIVAIGRMVQVAMEAAQQLSADGIECEIVDPRTLAPLDGDTICSSVARTGRLVVADEANPRCGMAADIAALVAEHAFDSLRAPVRTVTAPHAPVPFSPALEDLYVPSAADIVRAVRQTHSQQTEGSQ